MDPTQAPPPPQAKGAVGKRGSRKPPATRKGKLLLPLIFPSSLEDTAPSTWGWGCPNALASFSRKHWDAKKKNAFYAEGPGGSPILEEQEELEAGFTASPAHPGAPVAIYPRMK